MSKPFWKEEERADAAIETLDLINSKLIVLNDEVNTFDWVIQSLMEVLNHTSIQAEQLSLMIHHRGKAIVKNGSFTQLKPYKDALVERGLGAIIETG